MTFTEWFKETYDDNWHEDYALDYGFAIETSDKYEEWCAENTIQPIWNG